MPRRPTGSSRQPELFTRSKRPAIWLPDNHPMVVLTEIVDWTAMEHKVQEVRARKLKSAAGRPPHLRATIGALVLMALRRLPYREVEEQMRYYAPARYLCGLTETEWTPDFTTVQDFAELLGEDGVRLINEAVVKQAVGLGLADPKMAVGDLTAQEAAVPYPNEMGLLGDFVRSVETAAGKAGRGLRDLLAKVGGKIKTAKARLREYHLFARKAVKAAKDKMLAQTAKIVEGINDRLGKALAGAADQGRKLRGHALVARRKLRELHASMTRLLPQIRYWLRTGYVAAGKIINLHIPQLYSIVRGKTGKMVEFGLLWGITRLGGGFVLAAMASDKKHLTDSTYAVSAVEKVVELFGRAPRAYAYDRAGYSAANVERLRALGVRHVGLAPRGRADWHVKGKVKNRLLRERAQVEGCIGTIKSHKYGFNRPAARSARMMGVCGQRAVLGLNLTKLLRGVAGNPGVSLAA